MRVDPPPHDPRLRSISEDARAQWREVPSVESPVEPPGESPAQSPIGVTRRDRAVGNVRVQTPISRFHENAMCPPSHSSRDEGAVYRLTVRGRVGEGWKDWFGADTLRPGDTTTEIVVRVADQAELLGRLRRVLDLDLQLIELVRARTPDSEGSGHASTIDTDVTDTTGDTR